MGANEQTTGARETATSNAEIPMSTHYARLRAALLVCLLLILAPPPASTAAKGMPERPVGTGGLEAVDRDGQPLGPLQ